MPTFTTPRPAASDGNRRLGPNAALMLNLDILAMQALSPLSSAYLPWSMSAMRPSGVVAVLNEIVVNRRRAVVELGGGVSTCYIGRLLASLGAGHLWTIEHDERWADFLRNQLVSEGLDQVVTVVCAGLESVESRWPDEKATWYDREQVRGAMAGQLVDLLLVDGPPAYQSDRTHARYPALPFFRSFLADDYAVILDDVSRVGEQDIIRCWEGEFGITFEHRLIDGGIGVGRVTPGYSI
jgi:hypothetical protein